MKKYLLLFLMAISFNVLGMEKLEDTSENVSLDEKYNLISERIENLLKDSDLPDKLKLDLRFCLNAMIEIAKSQNVDQYVDLILDFLNDHTANDIKDLLYNMSNISADSEEMIAMKNRLEPLVGKLIEAIAPKLFSLILSCESEELETNNDRMQLLDKENVAEDLFPNRIPFEILVYILGHGLNDCFKDKNIIVGFDSALDFLGSSSLVCKTFKHAVDHLRDDSVLNLENIMNNPAQLKCTLARKAMMNWFLQSPFKDDLSLPCSTFDEFFDKGDTLSVKLDRVCMYILFLLNIKGLFDDTTISNFLVDNFVQEDVEKLIRSLKECGIQLSINDIFSLILKKAPRLIKAFDIEKLNLLCNYLLRTYDSNNELFIQKDIEFINDFTSRTTMEKLIHLIRIIWFCCEARSVNLIDHIDLLMNKNFEMRSMLINTEDNLGIPNQNNEQRQILEVDTIANTIKAGRLCSLSNHATNCKILLFVFSIQIFILAIHYFN